VLQATCISAGRANRGVAWASPRAKPAARPPCPGDSTSATPTENFTEPFLARAGRVSSTRRLSTRWVAEKARPWTRASAIRPDAVVSSSSPRSWTLTEAGGSRRAAVTTTTAPRVARVTS
jgi:hypothetical protein